MVTITRLFDFPYYQLEKNNIPDCLVTKYNGEWIKTSTQEYIDKANAISRALLRLGVQKNDKIAVISTNNRTEWNIMDIGALQVGAQNVPIYPTIGSEDYDYILNHSESSYCFVSDQGVYDKVAAIQANVPSLKDIYSFDVIPGCKNWTELLELGADSSNQDVVEDRKNNVKPEELATIIYTSGTTGRPKGVMLSHNNIVSNVLDSAPRIPFAEGTSLALSFLPICHIFERIILYIYQYYSVSIYFAESIEKLTDNLKEVHPNVMTVVPRLLEKVYDKIYAKGAELTGIKKLLFFWAVNLGLKYKPYGANGWWYEKQLALARKLIFSKWKEALGGNLDVMVCGSAALQHRLSRVFAAANIPVMEGYGLTETSPVITVNDMRNGLFRVGTVGKLIKNVEVKIAEDGEILCKGPNVMMGYYKDEKLTNEVIVDGYFHTGDIGEFDSDGFLRITDRKKDLIKTAGGKYVAPQKLEGLLKQEPLISQVLIHGDQKKYIIALITFEPAQIEQWAKSQNIEYTSVDELYNNISLKVRIQKHIQATNSKLSSFEAIKKFEILKDTWTVDNGSLTQSLKVKRKFLESRYIDLIKEIYD
jgi:long-chain acyl-CoA synthetase